MQTLITLAALLLSTLFIQFGSSALGAFGALAGAANGFSVSQIGLMGSGHFAGFLIACIITPRWVGHVGHARIFSAGAAVGAASVLLHPVLVDPWQWCALRVFSGMSVASCYTVVESWLNAKVEKHNRASITGVYRFVDGGAALLAQGMIAFLDPAHYLSFNLLALFFCLCLLPLALTRRVPPQVAIAPRVQAGLCWKVSPLASVGVICAGMGAGAFRTVGPVFGLQIGLDRPEIALLLAAAALGSVLVQIPLGYVADRIDRRHVLIGIASGAVASAAIMLFASLTLRWEYLYVGAFVFGASGFTIYSLSASHANDYAPSADHIVDLNASLLFFYGVGAIAGPAAASSAMEAFGANGFLVYVALVQIVLIAYGFWRMTRRPSGTPRTRYRYVPRTSMLFARLAGRAKRAISGEAVLEKEKGGGIPGGRE